MKDEEFIIDVAFKGLCCLVVAVVSYILLRLINVEALSSAITSIAISAVLFLAMLGGSDV